MDHQGRHPPEALLHLMRWARYVAMVFMFVGLKYLIYGVVVEVVKGGGTQWQTVVGALLFMLSLAVYVDTREEDW